MTSLQKNVAEKIREYKSENRSYVSFRRIEETRQAFSNERILTLYTAFNKGSDVQITARSFLYGNESAKMKDGSIVYIFLSASSNRQIICKNLFRNICNQLFW